MSRLEHWLCFISIKINTFSDTYASRDISKIKTDRFFLTSHDYSLCPHTFSNGYLRTSDCWNRTKSVVWITDNIKKRAVVFDDETNRLDCSIRTYTFGRRQTRNRRLRDNRIIQCIKRHMGSKSR